MLDFRKAAAAATGGGGGARGFQTTSFDKYNRWYGDPFRKISLTGQPVRDVKINPQDVHGYAKIRHIKRNQRPVLSESAAEDLTKMVNVGVYDDESSYLHSHSNHADDDDDEDDVGDDYRMVRSSFTQQQLVARNLKVRSLDRQASSVTSQK